MFSNYFYKSEVKVFSLGIFQSLKKVHSRVALCVLPISEAPGSMPLLLTPGYLKVGISIGKRYKRKSVKLNMVNFQFHSSIFDKRVCFAFCVCVYGKVMWVISHFVLDESNETTLVIKKWNQGLVPQKLMAKSWYIHTCMLSSRDFFFFGINQR